MAWDLIWTQRATKDLRKIEKSAAGRIIEGLSKFAEQGQGDLRRIQRSAEYRLRVGDWRVRILLDQENENLVILRVANRKTAYQ